jgi:uncharacterized membrane protein
MSSRVGIIGLALTVLLVGAVAGGLAWFGPGRPPPGVTMSDLGSVQQLQDRFNTDKGTIRLVVIFSPT